MPFLFLLWILLISSNAHAKKEKLDDTLLGVIESLEIIINNHREEFKKQLTKYQKNGLTASKLNGYKEVNIAPLYMKSILLHSEKQYVKLIKQHECNFYSMLENGLLKTTLGTPSTIMVEAIKKGSEKVEVGLVKIDTFLDMIYKKRCFPLKEASFLFTKKNLKATIDGLKLTAPKTQKLCKETLAEWKSNIYLPYMCKIKKVLDDGSKAANMLKVLPLAQLGERRKQRALLENSKQIDQTLSYFQKQFIDNLCENMADEKKYCATYLSKSVWHEVINGEQPFSKLRYWCRIIRRKKQVDARDLSICREVLEKDGDLCTTRGIFTFSALLPKPNCFRIAKALAKSRLKTNYQDCPGKIDNASITNIHRILMHMKPREIKSDEDSCAYEANYSYAKLNIDYGNEDGWPMKVCYLDRLNNKEICRSYVPGESEDSAMSENNVIAKALRKLEGAPSNLKCYLVEKKKYNPVLLSYRTGCFIIYDKENCTTLRCPKEIIYDKKKVAGIKFIGVPKFDYFPSGYQTARFSANSMMQEVYKFQSKKIRNLTELKFHFDMHKNAVAHGIGCIEDIYPWMFGKRKLNQCRPIPFIIDGLVEKNGNLLMSIRTALDDIHSPRLLSWNYIFGAVVNYSELHPTRLWALYGVK